MKKFERLILMVTLSLSLPSSLLTGPYFLLNFPLTTHVRVFDAAKIRSVLQSKTCIDKLGCFVWIPNSQQHISYHFLKALAIQRNYDYAQFGIKYQHNLPFRWYCPSWRNCIDSYRKDFLRNFSHNIHLSKPFVWACCILSESESPIVWLYSDLKLQ